MMSINPKREATLSIFFCSPNGINFDVRYGDDFEENDIFFIL